MRRDKVASAVGDGALAVAGNAGDISNSVTKIEIHGAVAQPLSVAAKDPNLVFGLVNLAEFTGREWLLAEMDQLIAATPCGYVFIEADAGVGKSAFAAWLVKTRGYHSHFSMYSEGKQVEAALANLSAQLIIDFKMDDLAPGAILPDWARTPGSFESLLSQAAAKARVREQYLVLVVDGLDEAEASPDGLPFGLPLMLPEGVYIVATYRTGHAPRKPSAPAYYLRIARDDGRNLQDIRQYLRREASEYVLAAALARAGMDEKTFTDALTEGCGGVWAYVRPVLRQLRMGQRDPSEISDLPPGLYGYYAEQIERWQNEPQWENAGRALLATLAVAREPLTIETLARLSGHLDSRTTRRWCDLNFRPFLATIPGSQTHPQMRYDIYHASFRETANPSVETIASIDTEHYPHVISSIAEDLQQAAAVAHHRICDVYFEHFGGLNDGLPQLAHNPCAAEIDDGYSLRNLAWHLLAVGRSGDLNRLLSAEWQAAGGRAVNIWFASQESAGSLNYYLQDLSAAQAVAAAATDMAIADGRHADTLGTEVLYALMAASITSLTVGIPNELLPQILRTGLWTQHQALDHARRIADPSARYEALLLIRQELGPAHQALVLAQALDTVAITRKAEALVNLAPYLPPDLLAGAVDIAAAISHDYSRAWTLAQLSPHLSADQFTLALDKVTAMAADDSRAQALAALAPHLPPDLRVRALDEAAAITNDSSRTQALGDLAPHLPPDLLVRAVEKAAAISDEDLRALALTRLAPHLPPDLLVRAVDIVAAVTNDRPRARALTAIAPHLPADQRSPVLAQALAAAIAITYDAQRASALADLAQYLPADQLTEATVTAVAITREDPRARALIAVVPHLPADQRGPVLAQALDAAAAITDDARRGFVLADLAPHLPPDLLVRAVDKAAAVSDDRSRARALTALAPRLPPVQQSLVLAQALDAAIAIGNEFSRDHALADLLPLLPQSGLARALDKVAAITSDDLRARALRSLAPHLPPDLLACALDMAAAITDGYPRAQALADLASHLPADLLARLLEKAAAIADDDWRARTLTDAAPHLPPELLARALDIAAAITDNDSRARALTSLAPHLPPELLARA